MTRPPRATTLACRAVILAMGLSLPSASCFAAERPQQARTGKSIYLKGGSGLLPPIRVIVNGTPALRSQKTFACVACHGTQGQGSAESGIRVPPIDWRTLTTKRPTGEFGKSRPAYDPAAVIMAVRSGIDPSGRSLGPAMPRYDLDDGQAAALKDYLEIVGTAVDTDPGVTPGEITVGTVLPMSGPLADVGAAVTAALQARFDEANASGGIYGRRVTLIVADSRGDPGRAAAEARRLIEKDGVFAIVGCLLPVDDQALNALLTDDDVPVVGPIAPPPTEAQARTSTAWHLLPTFYDQARVLVDEARSASASKASASKAPFRTAIVYADTAQGRDAADGARRQLDVVTAPADLEIMLDPDHLPAVGIAERIHEAGIAWVFFFGSTPQIEQFAQALAALPQEGRPELAGLTALSPAPRLPPSMRVMLAAAMEPPGDGQRTTLAAFLERSGRQLGRPALQAIAYAAASVLVEGVTRAGRQLGRVSLARELGRLSRFDTGVMPQVDFGPNRHAGVRGALILRVDQQGASYVPIGRFRAPAE